MSRWQRGQASIGQLLADGELERLTGAAADGGPWLSKARRTLATAASAADTDPDSAFTLAYDAVGHQHADDCPASLAGYRQAIDELTQRIEGLTARRSALLWRLRQAAHRNSSIPPPHDEDLMTYAYVPEDLPVPADDGAAGHLPGTRMPPLTLPGTTGEAVRLDALGSGRTVLYIYPLTGRPGTDLPEGWAAIPGARGCTPEACGFRDHHEDLLAAGAARVLGLSSQDTGYQREVVQRLGLPFQMLADPAMRLVSELGLPTFSAGGMTLYKRLTLIISGSMVEHVFYPVFPPGEHAQQVLSWLGNANRSSRLRGEADCAWQRPYTDDMSGFPATERKSSQSS